MQIFAVLRALNLLKHRKMTTILTLKSPRKKQLILFHFNLLTILLVLLRCTLWRDLNGDGLQLVCASTKQTNTCLLIAVQSFEFITALILSPFLLIADFLKLLLFIWTQSLFLFCHMPWACAWESFKHSFLVTCFLSILWCYSLIAFPYGEASPLSIFY